MEACAAALAATPCGSYDGPPSVECDFRGSLSAGAPCSTAAQCASGSCSVSGPLTSPGGILPRAYTCGTCAAVVQVGHFCDGGNCVRGAACITLNPNGAAPASQCVGIVEGTTGASCDGITTLCKPGYYCDHLATHRCLPLGELGAPCNARGADGCVTPLVCLGSPSTCQAPAALGAACDFIQGVLCQAGLTCSSAGTCESVEWADPGEPCDGVTTFCRQGFCPSAPITGAPTPGNCPVIVPDGGACQASGTCEADSECVNTSAAPGALTGTCEPLSTADCR